MAVATEDSTFFIDGDTDLAARTACTRGGVLGVDTDTTAAAAAVGGGAPPVPPASARFPAGGAI